MNYYITNIEHKYVTPEWMYFAYQKRNWVEVFVKLKLKDT